MLLAGVSVVQYRNDDGNTGQNLNETTLTPANVNPTDFGKLYQYPVDGYVYAEPLYLPDVTIPGKGTHNVVFVATEHDSVYAFDADGNVAANGTPLWRDSFIKPSAGITTLTEADVFNVGDLIPEVGITATPVIDPNTGTLYVVTKTKDIKDGVEHVVQELRALNVDTGAEMDGGPVVIADTTVNPDGSYTYNSGPSVAGTGDGNVNNVVTFNSLTQNERAALVLNDGVVYTSWSSHGDTGPYHGWVLGYNASTLALTSVFNTTPNGGQGAIWGAGQGLAVDSQGNMYFVTGNGTFDTTLDPTTGLPSSADYGDSVVKIGIDPSSTPANPNPNGWGLKVLDYFTPSDQHQLDNNDTDFGSGGPLLLPATQTGPQVVLAAGKEGTIFAIDTDTGHMGEFNASSNNVYQEVSGQIGGIWGAPAYFDGAVYYGSVSDNLKVFALGPNNTLSAMPTSTSPEGFGYPGPTPDISADGTSDGIVWALDNGAYGAQSPAVLYAYDPTNLQNEFYNSNDSGSRDQAAGAVKFTVPMIADGHVYEGGEYGLTIYGLLASVTAPAAPTKLVAQSISNNQISLSWQNNSASETGFTIMRSTNGTSFTAVATIGPYVNTYVVGDLSASTRYYYQLVATNSVGNSAASNTAEALTSARTLPTGWSDADIGTPGFAGSASDVNGHFAIYASGADIWGTADEFHYVFRTLTGDGTIVARVLSQQYTDPWAKAGVMMRQSLDANSPYAFVMATPGNGLNFEWRTGQGASADQGNNNSASGTAPYWVKLVRAGSTFTSYVSPDGQNWNSIGSIVIPMSTEIYVGLAVDAHDDSLINESTIDYVNVSQPLSHGYVAIDAGSGAVGTFLSDRDANGGSVATVTASINTSAVTNPAPVGVYQSERQGTFTYTIPGLTPGASFVLRLHFSENTYDSAGKRLFNVSIGGTQVLKNLDVFAATGGMNTALIEQFLVTANSHGQLVVSFTPSAGSLDQRAEVAGIEVVPITPSQQFLAQPSTISTGAGQTFSGTLATFVDTSPGGQARDYFATTQWGDGSITRSTIVPDPTGDGFDVDGSHAYQHGGRFDVTITIVSLNGAETQIALVANVTGPPLLVSIGTARTVQATVGVSTAALVIGTFSDTNPDATAKTVMAKIAWGDGSDSTGKVVAVAGGFTVSGSHTYATATTFHPTVTFADSGSSIKASTTTIVVKGNPKGKGKQIMHRRADVNHAPRYSLAH
jgi:hypothetical protein